MISFALTEDQLMVQETARKFAVEEIRPRLREFEKARDVPDELRRRFFELGMSLVDIPEAQGGMGMGMLTAAVVHEELAFGDPGAAVALWGPHTVGAALVELATPEQARRLLERFASSDGWRARGAVAWSETGKGLPAEGFSTRAVRDGDGWILDGEKAFVVNGGRADLVVVFAQVDPAAGWKGIAAFAVEGTNPGLKPGAPSEWLGLETVHAQGIRLEGCRVADADRLAGSPDVVAATARFFARAAIVQAARQVGLARAAYEYALAYTQDRVAFGKPVAHFQAISFTLAEMAMDVDAARLMVWRAAVELDRGGRGAEVAAAKAATQANDAAWRVADHAVQLLGGAGYVQDHPVEKWLRDTKALALASPTDQQSQLMTAALALGRPNDLGAPLPEPWLQPILT